MKERRSLRESLNTDSLSGKRPKVRDQRQLRITAQLAMGAAEFLNQSLLEEGWGGAMLTQHGFTFKPGGRCL